jgi:superfamily I DNA/RNA helicase
MLDDFESTAEDDIARLTTFEPARFHANLGLPAADQQLRKDAATAVRQEYRDCSKWKRLRCRKVSIFAERDRGTVCVVHVGRSVEFDWTWEGAIAFRPRSLDENGLFSESAFRDARFQEVVGEDEIVWSGEVLEVDERNGCLFISLENPEALPTTGSFFVRPFEFLLALDAVFNESEFDAIRVDLSSRLAATEGGIHPVFDIPKRVGLPHLQRWWQHTWNVLWGPPGTGKTWTTGQQIAAVLEDPTERILVVSTTNRATDAVALSIGNAARSRSSVDLEQGRLLRIGKGASLQSFAASGLEPMLRGTESEILHKIDELAGKLRLSDTWEEKALTRKQIGELRAGGGGRSKRNFVDSEVRVVVSTAFKATCFLREELIFKMLNQADAPFTTIFIDEAGLMSRPAIAALSYLAARRVVLVGDSKQLAPISRISRILPTRQQQWLASSGLSHLDNLDETPTAVHVLSEQRRMHPDVCQVVSEFQYGGFLRTAEETRQRESAAPPTIAGFSRAIWYVLDEEGSDLAAIRARRGPGNKSWVRAITSSILEKIFSDFGVRESNGLFISPYKAQAQSVARLFASWGLTNWEASTVHSQQGSEADVVIFDTVNAGSYNWPFDEWKRLVNVALSRAREAFIVLASRSEMDEPYLKPLLSLLTPSILIAEGQGFQWERLDSADGGFRSHSKAHRLADAKEHYQAINRQSDAIGNQLNQRKQMSPVLSQEQQRLTNLHLDGRPRLVRGVAGSGKSIVLCNWLAKTAKRLGDNKEVRIWAVYANRSLHKLLRESVESAWNGLSEGELFERPEFPWERVQLLHVKDVLAGLLPSASLSMEAFEFDYDRAAEVFLNRLDAEEILPRCSALFIDEAQDMGPFTLKLLLSLVEQSDADDPNSRSAHIFYDNAQNIYGRKTPKWSEFGLDMRGRSSIMRESFRSTTPIAELAVNVLHRLTPPEQRQDQHELMRMGLIEKGECNGEEWLRVRFNQIEGPKPIFHVFHNRTDEINALAGHLQHLIQVEKISPMDICVIYNGKSVVQLLETKLGPKMSDLGVELSVQTNRPFERRANTLVVTTSHSFKGYEAEVVIIPCVDQFVTGDGQILANNLYVAMTRARSLLAIYSIRQGSTASRQVWQTIDNCVEALNTTPDVEMATSVQDDLNDILDRIGIEHRKWLINLWKRFAIRQEPLTDADGTVLAEPLFWFEQENQRLVCFGDESVSQEQQAGFQQLLITVLNPGESL